MGYFLLFLLAFLVSFASGSDLLGTQCFNTGANYSASIPTVEGMLLSQIAKHGGYATASSGGGSSAVYGLLQCRGDVSLNDCISCGKDAANLLRTQCSNQADARVWYDFCFLRYDTENFFGKSDSGAVILYWNVNTVTDTAMFERKLKGVMDSVRGQALKPNSGGLGRDKVKLSPFNELYGLAQCTGDLPTAQCESCLADAYTYFQDNGSLCKDQQGCRVLSNGCYVRYEIYPFYFPLYSSPKPTPVSHAYLSGRKKVH
ncbi:cysteine-rich repeat secretory protein 55-like [Nymphaea colorata]|nr:cysteine-rich repeat secretory protein 55-like [Nymphaea colorata]